MDTTKEVVQKLAKLNIDPPTQAPIQTQRLPPFIPKRTSSLTHAPSLRLACNASCPDLPGQGPDIPFDPAGQIAGAVQTLSATKPEAVAAGLEPSDNMSSPIRKPFRDIASNIANSLARSDKLTNTGHRTISGGITKYRNRIRTGVDKFLRRDASGASSTEHKPCLKKKSYNERRLTRTRRAGAISEGLRKRLGLKREGATLGVIEEEGEEENTTMEGIAKMLDDVKVKESMKTDEDTVMEG